LSCLLQEQDFLPKNDLFLKESSTDDQFPFKFGICEIQNGMSIRRLVSVLPLRTWGEKIVPIPFIVDTGAPCSMNLGTGATKKLFDYELLTKVEGIQGEIGRLKGRLCFEEKELINEIIMSNHYNYYL